MSGRQQRVMVQPINVIFRNLQQKTKVIIWLYDNVEMRIHGRIIASPDTPAPSRFANYANIQGFDEFMNVVVDEAEEVYAKDSKPRRSIGRILLKGDNITLIQPAGAS
ncbi:mRNA splicing protein sme1 [Ceratobasidium sp. 370]|nr:mRNA splicing protein sme1 [Ceratobasidium sp. 370]